MKKVKKVTKIKTINISIPFTDKSFGFYIQNKKSSRKISKKDSKQNLKKRNINYKLIIRAELLILVMFFIIGIYQIYTYVPGVKEAVALATTVKPETFTELYFENHTSLPSKITYNQENKFQFTIHNLENKDMSYPYEVYINVNGEKQIIDQSSVFVKSGEYKTIPESFTLTLPTGKIQVIANLIDKNQQILFWVNGTSEAAQPELSDETVQPALSSEAAQLEPIYKTIQPKTLTELYFDNNLPLPFIVIPNQTSSFAFTVHNLRDQDFTYPYEVYLEENGQTTQIDKSQFSLKQNEYKTITESYVLTTPVKLGKIFIKLTNEENNYIYFEVKGDQ